MRLKIDFENRVNYNLFNLNNFVNFNRNETNCFNIFISQTLLKILIIVSLLLILIK